MILCVIVLLFSLHWFCAACVWSQFVFWSMFNKVMGDYHKHIYAFIKTDR